MPEKVFFIRKFVRNCMRFVTRTEDQEICVYTVCIRKNPLKMA